MLQNSSTLEREREGREGGRGGKRAREREMYSTLTKHVH